MKVARSGLEVRVATVHEAGAVLDLLCTGKKTIPLAHKVCSEDFRNEYLEWMRGLCRRRQVKVIGQEPALAAMLVIAGSKISYLVVGPDFRRQGFARSLLAYAKRRRPQLRA